VKSKNSSQKDRSKNKVVNRAFSPKVEVYEGEEFADNPTNKFSNLAKVKFVDKTDPKFNELRPKANVQTLKGVYAKIAQAALNAKKFSTEALLRSSEHNLEAHKQNLLPQVTPGASIDADGDTIVQLSVQQTLYDSGRYAAGKDILLSEKATALANRKLEQQSESRIYNGIGDSSDRDLYQLKKLEVESEYENHEAIALSSKQVFMALTGIAMPTAKPTKMNLEFDSINAPQVELAEAERYRAIGTMKLEKSNQRPLISIAGNVGTATDTFDDQNMDVRLDVSVSQPLAWGFDHASAAVQSDVEASNRKYDEVLKDTEDQINILKFELAQSRLRLKRLQRLSENAQKRLKNFRSQFLAGQAGIAEATSTIEAFKKIQNNEIETEFSIYSAELELANLTGALSAN
jgi:outer membrane protein TolC